MKQKIKNKLKNKKGESISESLVALLIVTLAMLMLSGAIVSAARVNKNTADINTGLDTDSQSKEVISGFTVVIEDGDGQKPVTNGTVTGYRASSGTSEDYIYYTYQAD